MTANRTIVERYFASRGTEYAQLLADDVELIEWADGGPAAGVRTQGKAAYVQNRGDRKYATQIGRLVEGGPVVVVEGTARGTSPEGRPWAVQFCDIFELEHGKIRRLSSYGATLQATP